MHVVLLQYLLCPFKGLSCNNLAEKTKDLLCSPALRCQLEYLDDTMWQDHVFGCNYKSTVASQNMHKNRIKHLLPGKKSKLLK